MVDVVVVGVAVGVAVVDVAVDAVVGFVVEAVVVFVASSLLEDDTAGPPNENPVVAAVGAAAVDEALFSF